MGFRTRQQVVGSELGKTDPWKLWEQAQEQEGDPLWPPRPLRTLTHLTEHGWPSTCSLMVAGAPEALKDH